MTKADWFTTIEKGMAAAKAEKMKPSLKTVGPGGAGEAIWENENNINMLQERILAPLKIPWWGPVGRASVSASPGPTENSVVGPGDVVGKSSKKQAIRPCASAAPPGPTNLNAGKFVARTLAISRPGS